jgi:hypothetical protein
VRALLPLLALIAATAVAQPSPDRREATEGNYRGTLQRLGIQAIRPGADGFNRSAPNAANYDEARVGTVAPLPPLLTDLAGRPVTSRGDWQRRRREIVELFDREMYGRVPASAPAIRWDLVEQQNRELGGRRAVTRRYLGQPTLSSLESPRLAMELVVILPEGVRGRVPLVLELGFPEGFRFPGAPPPPSDPDWRAQALARGWGFAVLVPSSVQPDDGAGLREGAIGFASGGEVRANDQWGALRAWAWGASRALDLLSADRLIDRRRIAVAGLSRYGKAALVAMAYDERFAAGLIGSSGAGGAKLMRRDFGERIGNLAASGEYHWFAPNFLRYAGPRPLEELPVDAHMLIAMAAPRPIFIGAGSFDADGWVDPRGSFIAAQEASSVYGLLGQTGLDGAYPAINECRCQGRVAFRQHDGGHSNGPNWDSFFDFAERQWGARRR